MTSSIRILAVLGTLSVAIFSVYYQLILKDLLTHAGYWRTSINGLNNAFCKKIPELQACEKAVRHPSGILYFACSTPASRTVWEPCMGFLNASARSLTDYVATYDPDTSKITRLRIAGFPSSIPLAVHGFDIAPMDGNPTELFVYMVNHRPPQGDAQKIGADSVIEVFKTKLGGDELVHVATVEDPSVIIVPNDIVGYGDGSFHFTNNARSKRGIMRTLDLYLRLPGMSVGYCHIHHGCKIAARGLRGANGIARDNNGLYFVVSDNFGEISVLEKQEDNSLVLTDVVKTDMPMDNISAAGNGTFYIAAFPKGLQFLSETAHDPTIPSPSAVLRLSRNTGPGQFYGEKFKVEKIFEDDGQISSAATTALWDSKSKKLYLTGLSAFHVTACEIHNP